MFSRLYLHIPWCVAKCGYCAFSSRQGTAADLDATVELLLAEMELAAHRFPAAGPLASLYLGGGTPSLLTPEQVERLVQRSRLLWGHEPFIEITLEANPGTVSFPSLAGFRRAGVTRLSLGAQSFDDDDLALLGRVHRSAETVQAVAWSRETGFDSLGLDLICGLPGQTPTAWRRQLETACGLAPDHLSIYNLTIEEETPFSLCYPEGNGLPDDDLTADMLEEADGILAAAGFEHYELANYARPGKRSQHNCGYWLRDGYLGLGPSAHSFLRDGWGMRFCNPPHHDAWADSIRAGCWAGGETIRLSREEARAETIFLGLRLACGISLERFEQVFGERLELVWREQIQRLEQGGLLRCENDCLHLTRKGMLLSNRVFVEFL